jgi:hypothetical protein
MEMDYQFYSNGFFQFGANVIDLLTQFHKTNPFAAYDHRGHYPQGQGPQGTQLQSVSNLSGPFRFQGRKAVYSIPVSVGLMDTEDVDPLGIAEIQMGYRMLERYFFE